MIKNAQSIKINGVEILAVPVKLCRFNNNKKYYWLETQDGNSICTVTTMSKNTCESVNSGRITEKTKLWVECISSIHSVTSMSPTGLKHHDIESYELRLDSSNHVIVHVEEVKPTIQELKSHMRKNTPIVESITTSASGYVEEEVKKDRNYAIESDYTEPLKKRFREIEEVKEETNGWISVKERLPEGGKTVLLFAKRDHGNSDEIIKGCYNLSFKYFETPEACEDENIFPTHWMELPPKPKTK